MHRLVGEAFEHGVLVVHEVHVPRRLEQRQHDLVEEAFQQHRHLRVAHRLGHLVLAQQQGRVSQGEVAGVEHAHLHLLPHLHFVAELHAHIFERGAAVGEAVLDHPLGEVLRHQRDAVVQAAGRVEARGVFRRHRRRDAIDQRVGKGDAAFDPGAELRVARAGEADEASARHFAVVSQVVARHPQQDRSIREAAHILQQALHRCLALLQVSGETRGSILFVDWVCRFGDTVAVECDPRPLAERDRRLRVVAVANAQRQAHLSLEKRYSGIVHQDRRKVPAICELKRPSCRIQHAVNHGHKPPRREVLDHQPVQLGQDFRWTAGIFGKGARHRPRSRHQQCRCRAFSRNIRQHQSPTSILQINEVVPITANRARRYGETGHRKSWNERRTPGQQSLLDRARLLGLTAHLLPRRTLLLKQPSVLHRNSDVVAESLEQSQLVGGEGVHLGMRRR